MSDGQGGIVSQAYQLSIKNVNRAPEFVSLAKTQTQVDSPYRYQVLAQDPDWNPLAFKLVTKPKGMILDKNTLTVYWPAQQVTVGDHAVEIEVSDGKLSVMQSFNLKVVAEEAQP